MDVASVLDEIYFVEMCREAKASAKALESKCCRFVRCHVPEEFCGYMVKRISAHGGCLGGQRR